MAGRLSPFEALDHVLLVRHPLLLVSVRPGPDLKEKDIGAMNCMFDR